eukprot:1880312-Pleurochrysis_carterae.AAC.3
MERRRTYRERAHARAVVKRAWDHTRHDSDDTRERPGQTEKARTAAMSSRTTGTSRFRTTPRKCVRAVNS